MTEKVLLCITSGRGPKECRLAALSVFRHLEKEAVKLGFSVSSTAHALDKSHYPSSILVALTGENLSHFAHSWIGTVQWIAKSPFRDKKSRQNWFVGVHYLALPSETPTLDENDIVFATMRAGGPGGQHQNKTESAVRAIHKPSGLVAEARDGRSQHHNKTIAIERIKNLLLAQKAQEEEIKKKTDWISRISVERGNPIRIIEGDF